MHFMFPQMCFSAWYVLIRVVYYFFIDCIKYSSSRFHLAPQLGQVPAYEIQAARQMGMPAAQRELITRTDYLKLYCPYTSILWSLFPE